MRTPIKQVILSGLVAGTISGHADGKSCLSRLDGLLRLTQSQQSISNLQEFKRRFPTDATVESQFKALQEKSDETQKRTLALLSRLPSPSPLFNKLPGRLSAIRQTLSVVITEEAKFDRLLVRAWENYDSLSLSEKRALLLMLNHQWWFNALNFNRAYHLAWYRSFVDFIRPSSYLYHWLATKEFTMKYALDEITHSGFIQRAFNRFSYSKQLQQQIRTANDLDLLIDQLKQQHNQLLKKWSESDIAQEKTSLKNHLAHMENIISILSAPDQLFSPPWQFAGTRATLFHTVAEGEKITLFTAQLYALSWLVSQWLMSEQVEMSSDQALAMQEWNSPVIEEIPSKISPQERLLIHCNQGLIAAEDCLRLLASPPNE